MRRSSRTLRTATVLVVLMLVSSTLLWTPGATVAADEIATVTEGDPNGGSWMDTFNDTTGIDWGASNNVTIQGGEARINRTYDNRTMPNGTWHLDEGTGARAQDSSGFGNTGTLKNGVTWTSGRYGKALSFDGSDDYVEFSYSSSFDMASHLSISLWVNKTSNVSYAGVVGRWDWNAYNLMMTNDGKKMRMEFMRGGSNYDAFDDTTEISNGVWTHLAVTFNDTSDKLRFYVNGSLSKEHSASNSYTLHSTTGLVFGSNSPSYKRYFSGAMDEIEVFNQPLGGDEIKMMYEKGPYRRRSTGNVTSIPITIPAGMDWDSIVIDKVQDQGTHLNVTVLNATDRTAIPGSTKLMGSGEFDISGIDASKYPSIRLNATFEDDGFRTPALRCWGVSWSNPGTWRDTLFGGLRVEISENVTILDGSVNVTAKGLPSNAVAIWRFDEGSGTSVDDATGNGNDGTIKNGATWTTGRYGKALDFDGTNDYVQISDDDAFDFGKGEFTVAAWIKTTATTGTGSGRDDIFAKGDPTISGYALSARSNKATFFVEDQGALYGSTNINDGSWHHIVGTKDSSGNIVLYVDGSSESTGTNSEDVDTTYDIFIGKHGTKSESFFDGLIDEVAVFSEALTSTEVKDLYKKGFGSGSASGYLVSRPIQVPRLVSWDRLMVNMTRPSGTPFKVAVIDAATNTSIPSFDNITSASTDLSAIDHRVHGRLWLRADLGTDGTNSSALHDWAITFLAYNDSDNDGVGDKWDAFPMNPFEYRDTDGDGLGDTIDPDADGDGTPDDRDAFPLNATETRDTDRDGTGDSADTDDDNDGVPDSSDAFPRNPREFQDSDGDGVGDNLDLDDDGDGALDDQEWMDEISNELATLMDMLTALQASLKDDLDDIQLSMESSMDGMGVEFLDELEGVNSSLAMEIDALVASIILDVEGLGMFVSDDIDDLETWADGVADALETKLASMDSSLSSEMDRMGQRSANFEQDLSDELDGVLLRLAEVEGNLSSSEDDVRAKVAALSAMTTDLNGHTLSELSALLADLAEDISDLDGATASELRAISDAIAGFEAEMAADLAACNRTLQDLEKLDTIMTELEELDLAMEEAKEELDASVHDTSNEQLDATSLNAVLIVVAMVLAVIALVLVFRMRGARRGF